MKISIKILNILAILQILSASSLFSHQITNPVDSPFFSLAEEMLIRVHDTDYIYNSVYVLWDDSRVDPYRIDARLKTDTTYLILVNDTSGYVHSCPGKIYSGFGPRGGRNHNGVDQALKQGDTVLCCFSGIVRFAKYYKGYGNMIIVTHYNGLETMYAHLSKMLVDVGDYVREGDVIGRGGATGRTTGAHLHFEVRYMGTAFNPELIIDFNNHKLISDTFMITGSTFKSSSRPYVVYSDASYHVIKQGDTLYALSKKYGVSIDRICALNGISRNTTLRIGKTLRIR